MQTNKLQQLAKIGQSVWLDYIERGFLESGGLDRYVKMGLRGLTSNPAIFQKAISNSNFYDDDIQRLALEGKSAQEIYEHLAIKDIQTAAKILTPVYEKTDGKDGYISMEVNPYLAHETQATIDEARRLTKAINKPNIMIKVPATAEGLLAIQTLTEEGFNINVTLMFSISQYDLVASAYRSGLEARAKQSNGLNSIASVASFFVSRIDSKVDPLLAEIDIEEAQALKGKIGIANAKIAYQHFNNNFSGEQWAQLTKKHARPQRVLYGSTSTKNPSYPDTLYVDQLIGPETVNTLPPDTLDAFLDHGTVDNTLEKDVEEARLQLKQLEAVGIQLDDITRQLLDEGIDKFKAPYDELIKTITEKQASFINS